MYHYAIRAFAILFSQGGREMLMCPSFVCPPVTGPSCSLALGNLNLIDTQFHGGYHNLPQSTLLTLF